MVFGQGSGLLLMKTLHCPRDLGIRNSTIRPKPSSWRDSVAMEYSASAMVLADRFPCLNVRKLTTGPGESSTWSLMKSWVGCSIVLSQVVFVISFRN